MTADPSLSGLEAVFLDNRDRLLRFLRSRGAGDAAEDLVQEVWLRIARRPPGPVDAPLPYLFRTADMLMIDRFRTTRQAGSRDGAWSALHDGDPPGASPEPSAERRMAARQEAARVTGLLDSLGPRASGIFRRHRIDGVAQKELAAEFGVSLSTVESELRTAYRALAEWREKSR